MYEVRMFQAQPFPEWRLRCTFRTIDHATQFAEILRNRGERVKVFRGVGNGRMT